METNQIHRAEHLPAISQIRRSSNPSSPIATLAWLAACLLILLGVAFELGMLGFGPYNSNNLWMFSAIGRNVWIMLSNLAVPELRDIARMWPLMLVSLGSAILLIARRWSRFDSMTVESSGRKENHAS
jgi:hypothetical protein